MEGKPLSLQGILLDRHFHRVFEPILRDFNPVLDSEAGMIRLDDTARWYFRENQWLAEFSGITGEFSSFSDEEFLFQAEMSLEQFEKVVAFLDAAMVAHLQVINPQLLEWWREDHTNLLWGYLRAGLAMCDSRTIFQNEDPLISKTQINDDTWNEVFFSEPQQDETGIFRGASIKDKDDTTIIIVKIRPHKVQIIFPSELAK